MAVAIAIGAVNSVQASAANIKSFIEAARKTPIVYVGVVRDVKELERSESHLIARANISISLVARGDSATREANFPFLTYDKKTPPMAGPPQYVLKPGTWVLVFATTFDGIRDGDAPHYLRQGNRDEVERITVELSEHLRQMTPEEMAFNEITKEDRISQLEMYDKALAYLRKSLR